MLASGRLQLQEGLTGVIHVEIKMKYLNFKPQDKGWSSRDEWFFAHINTVLVQIFERRIFCEFIISEFSQFHFRGSRDSVNDRVCRSTIKAKFTK